MRRGTWQRRGMAVLTVLASPFPTLGALQTHLSKVGNQLLTGMVLGGIAAANHALLTDGYLHWRRHGVVGIEPTRTLRVLRTALAHPILGAISGVIRWIGAAGVGHGVPYAPGAATGWAILGGRAGATAAMTR